MMSSREVGTHTTSPEAETSGPKKLKLRSVSDEIVAADEAGGEYELR